MTSHRLEALARRLAARPPYDDRGWLASAVKLVQAEGDQTEGVPAEVFRQLGIKEYNSSQDDLAVLKSFGLEGFRPRQPSRIERFRSLLDGEQEMNERALFWIGAAVAVLGFYLLFVRKRSHVAPPRNQPTAESHEESAVLAIVVSETVDEVKTSTSSLLPSSLGKLLLRATRFRVVTRDDAQQLVERALTRDALDTGVLLVVAELPIPIEQLKKISFRPALRDQIEELQGRIPVRVHSVDPTRLGDAFTSRD